MELPQEFSAQMKELLGTEYPDYVNSISTEGFSGLRVNTGKLSAKQFRSLVSWELSPVPWTKNGFYYGKELRPAKHPYYFAGLYYLQEPSAMTPATLLPISPGDRVLDLCAAPGGKSTELGARLKGEGMLLANDISNSRAKALLKNLELLGVPNFYVSSEAPKKLASVYPEFFDKILVDAPCSGEGMFRKDAGMLKSWLEHGPDFYAPLQADILESAVAMLKPGGYLMYSTCTFSKSEDEAQIRLLLEHHKELELCMLPRLEGFCDGIDLTGSVRLFPHKIQGEGHFLAMLRKCISDEGTDSRMDFGGGSGEAHSEYRKNLLQLEKHSKFQQFFEQILLNFDSDRFYIRENMVYYLPKGTRPHRSIRYLRTGLCLGEIKKERFEPSQALAMVLTPKTFEPSISFSSADERVLRYLKGETVALLSGEMEVEGWCLICVDGYSLGFAKGNKRMLKNKYYPGWRWQ